jgi:histidine triad (HIT) family protein
MDIFCQIIAGEIEAQVVLETENILVIKDINPKAPVHNLIIPKKHITSLNESTEDDAAILGEIVLVAQRVAEIEKIKETGYRLIANTGADGGQLVPHVHFHLLGGKSLGPKIVAE